MKKTFAMILAMALVCIVSVNTTLTYFSDTDGDANTMVVGQVTIVQHVKNRNGEEFQNKQNLYPAVILSRDEHGEVRLSKDQQGFWLDSDIKNEIDKVVTVENTGSNAAYVRTIFAFETGKISKSDNVAQSGYVHDSYLGVNGTMEFLYLDEAGNNPMTIQLNDTEYALAAYTYDAAVQPGKTTAASLRQFYLEPTAGNEFFDLVSGSYDILILSQAVQTEGFEAEVDDAGKEIRSAAEVALDTAFGKISQKTAQEWFASNKI